LAFTYPCDAPAENVSSILPRVSDSYIPQKKNALTHLSALIVTVESFQLRQPEVVTIKVCVWLWVSSLDLWAL